MHGRTLLIGTSATAAMLTLVVPAADLGPLDSGPPPVPVSRLAWDGTHRVRVYASRMRPAVRDAAAKLSTHTCLKLQWSGTPAAGRSAAPYQIVVRLVRQRDGPRALVSNAALSDGTSMRSVDIDINRSVLRKRRSVRRDIVLHELGHGLGLPDSASASSVMNAQPRKPYFRLGAQDRRALRTLGRCPATSGDCTRPDARGIALGLHGATGRGDIWGEASGWNDAARRHGLVPLTPTAREDWGRIWDIRPGSPDTVALLELVQRTIETECIDTDRIYVGGHSMGAMMAAVLTCTTRSFAAAAPLAGVVAPPGGCWPGSSLYAVHSADDPVVALDGTTSAAVAAVTPEWARTTSRLDATTAWARGGDCWGSTSSAGAVLGALHSEPYTDIEWSCPAGTRVKMRTFDHISHTAEPDWADHAMEFFDTVSR